jgi:1,4-dihydroxy-6-naphthoate synthase
VGEALNRAAFAGSIDITKLSYHAYAYVTDRYVLLDAGSALGRACGPLLIARAMETATRVEQSRIAIPGRYTTANFLLGLAFPNARDKVEMLFSDIEDSVSRGEVDAGLIIHENRFTYQQKGLVKLMDLGEFWETHTGCPIPLGGIVARRDLPLNILLRVNRALARSVAHARARPEQTYAYVRRHAQEMDPAVMYQHIDLYVNDYTFQLGPQGRRAVERLFDMAAEKGLVSPMNRPVFLSEMPEDAGDANR